MKVEQKASKINIKNLMKIMKKKEKNMCFDSNCRGRDAAFSDDTLFFLF